MKKPFDPFDPRFVERIEKRLIITKVVDTFTPPEGDDVVILGTYSRTWKNKKYREVLKKKTIDFLGWVDSPTAIARDYLVYCYERRPAKKEQRDILKNKRMPLYVYPCVMRDCVYLDIKSAWWAITCGVGWNVEYNPSRWVGRGQEPDDFPIPENKVARSSCVTVGRGGPLAIWKAGKIVYQRMYNNLENYHLWGIIADTLHAIATVAIESYECRYVNTDGFIIPTRHLEPLTEYINSWGLVARVKAHGVGVIGGAGAYRVGDHVTLRDMTFHHMDNIDRTIDREWLRQRVGKKSQFGIRLFDDLETEYMIQ